MVLGFWLCLYILYESTYLRNPARALSVFRNFLVSALYKLITVLYCDLSNVELRCRTGQTRVQRHANLVILTFDFLTVLGNIISIQSLEIVSQLWWRVSYLTSIRHGDPHF